MCEWPFQTHVCVLRYFSKTQQAAVSDTSIATWDLNPVARIPQVLGWDRLCGITRWLPGECHRVTRTPRRCAGKPPPPCAERRRQRLSQWGELRGRAFPPGDPGLPGLSQLLPPPCGVWLAGLLPAARAGHVGGERGPRTFRAHRPGCPATRVPQSWVCLATRHHHPGEVRRGPRCWMWGGVSRVCGCHPTGTDLSL